MVRTPNSPNPRWVNNLLSNHRQVSKVVARRLPVITRKFLYSLIYHPSESELVVVSLFHRRRKFDS